MIQKVPAYLLRVLPSTSVSPVRGNLGAKRTVPHAERDTASFPQQRRQAHLTLVRHPRPFPQPLTNVGEEDAALKILSGLRDVKPSDNPRLANPHHIPVWYSRGGGS